jgi:copper(I)-binding protein
MAAAMHIIKANNSRSAVRTALCFIGVHLAPAQAVATPASHRAGTIMIEDPRFQASSGGAKNAVRYMRLVNTGHEPDRLVGGAAVDLGRLEVHRSETFNGFARMLPLMEGLAIQPGETIELKPGSLHAILVDLPKGHGRGTKSKERLSSRRLERLRLSTRSEESGKSLRHNPWEVTTTIERARDA